MAVPLWSGFQDFGSNPYFFFLQSGPDFAQKSGFLTHFSVCWLTHWHSGPKLRGGEGGPGVSRVSGRSINSTLLTKIPNSYYKSSIVFIQNPAQPQLVLLSMVLACSVHDILEFFVARSCSWFSFWLSCSLGQDLGLCIYTLAGRGRGGRENGLINSLLPNSCLNQISKIYSSQISREVWVWGYEVYEGVVWS